ncbi:MAG: family 43 glycosylhydrolase [Bacteroidota bacterium]
MKKLCLSLIALAMIQWSIAQTYQNPILPGFHADPSICRAGDYYYLVNSTFEYFPGVPIHRSKDLVNWELVGHVVTRNSQLDMEGYKASAGIHAPTIRYHQGTFYVVFTNISFKGIENLLFTADSTMSRWSDAITITQGRPWGIDPDIFFDDDGKCYFMTNRKHPGKEPYRKYREIAVQELDLNTMELVGETWIIGSGNVKGATSTEGPHLYKKDGLYYLIVAEGGTGTNHAVTISSSESISGPYEPCPYNPILTHRFMQKNIELRNLGHADLVQTPEGDWWMVFLGVRYKTSNKPFTGRETFLVRVDWSRKYPVVNPGYSQVQYTYPLPEGVESQYRSDVFIDDFSDGSPDLSWTCLRAANDFAVVTPKNELKIALQPSTISELTSPSFLGKRVESASFDAEIDLRLDKLKEGEEVGMVLLADNEDFVKMVFTKSNLRLVESENTEVKVLKKVSYEGKDHKLIFRLRDQRLSAYFQKADGELVSLGVDLEAKSLSNYRYTGLFVGPYGSSNGQKTKTAFYVKRFEYANED